MAAAFVAPIDPNGFGCRERCVVSDWTIRDAFVSAAAAACGVLDPGARENSGVLVVHQEVPFAPRRSDQFVNSLANRFTYA